ncbi:MAG: DNA polymerase III subunit delta, partial [Chloroflexota bacterium]
MLHIFSGDDDFSVAQALKEIEAAWPESAILSANLSRLEGEGLSSGELQPTCNSAPFLAQQRLVVVR